jgi:hypothetical protein
MRGSRASSPGLAAGLLLAPALSAYVLFDAGGFLGYTWNKWGDPAPGTGAVVYWSYLPAGTPGSGYCGDACTGTSTTTLAYYDHSVPAWTTVDLRDLESYIASALATWSAAANVTFVGPIEDSAGYPVNDPGAVPPNTGHIRIGAFVFVGGAQFLGAVGYAPPPNGGTGEGDVLFNAASFFQAAPGTEDLTPIDFQFGNDFEGLVLHELGHAIGLGHSGVDGSVMYLEPAGEYLVNRELHADDLAGVQVLYGMPADTDGDGFADAADNCTEQANAGQQDTDGDGIGNACDGDFNGDCTVNFIDLGEMKSEFFHAGALEEDLNGDGVVNFVDLGLLKAGFFGRPGPSGLPNACGA